MRWFFVALVGCATSPVYLRAADMKPSGTAPSAQHRLLATHPDGSKDYMIVLHAGDEVMTALGDFARTEAVTAARFSGIGAVHDVDVGYFEAARKQYRINHFEEQRELLSIIGDVGVGPGGAPAVHAHVTLGGRDGAALGGHLVHAVTSPTVEIFVSTFPAPLPKRAYPELDLTLFDL